MRLKLDCKAEVYGPCLKQHSKIDWVFSHQWCITPGCTWGNHRVPSLQWNFVTGGDFLCYTFQWGSFISEAVIESRENHSPSAASQIYKLKNVPSVSRQCYMKQWRLTLWVQSCGVCRHCKAGHEHHSANLIKRGQHEVLSADRAAVVSMQPRRKTGSRFNCVLFSYKEHCCTADLSLVQRSAAVKFQSRRKRGKFFVACVWVTVNVWSWVGCIAEQESGIVERFGPRVEGKVSWPRSEWRHAGRISVSFALLCCGCLGLRFET